MKAKDFLDNGVNWKGTDTAWLRSAVSGLTNNNAFLSEEQMVECRVRMIGGNFNNIHDLTPFVIAAWINTCH